MAAKNIISNFVKKIENMASFNPGVGEKYGDIFYGKMVDKEIKLADISPGDKIAHLGSGPFPFTSFELARRGWEVEAIDIDDEAIKRAEVLSQHYGFASKIDFTRGYCQEIDYSQFDAVWVSYNVRPGKECLIQIAETIGEGGKIIYRQPRGWLKHFDGRADAEELFSDIDSGGVGGNGRLNNNFQWESVSVEQNVGKKSVMIEINPDYESENQQESVLRLEELAEPCSCEVCFVPDNTLLPPLGVRAGKKAMTLQPGPERSTWRLRP